MVRSALSELDCLRRQRTWHGCPMPLISFLSMRRVPSGPSYQYGPCRSVTENSRSRLIQRYRPARSLLSGCREGALMSVSWVLLRSIALLTLILLLSDHTTGPLCDCRERVAPRKLPGLPVRS